MKNARLYKAGRFLLPDDYSMRHMTHIALKAHPVNNVFGYYVMCLCHKRYFLNCKNKQSELYICPDIIHIYRLIDKSGFEHPVDIFLPALIRL